MRPRPSFPLPSGRGPGWETLCDGRVFMVRGDKGVMLGETAPGLRPPFAVYRPPRKSRTPEGARPPGARQRPAEALNCICSSALALARGHLNVAC